MRSVQYTAHIISRCYRIDYNTSVAQTIRIEGTEGGRVLQCFAGELNHCAGGLLYRACVVPAPFGDHYTTRGKIIKSQPAETFFVGGGGGGADCSGYMLPVVSGRFSKAASVDAAARVLAWMACPLRSCLDSSFLITREEAGLCCLRGGGRGARRGNLWWVVARQAGTDCCAA